MQQIQREFAGLEMDPDRLLRIIEPMAQKGVRDSSRYYRKFSIDYPQHIEKLAATFTVEEACALQSMISGQKRLREAGIMSLTSPDGIEKELISLKKRYDHLSNMIGELLLLKNKLESTIPKGRPMDAETKKRMFALSKVSANYNAHFAEVARLRAVTQFILEELQLTPWATTASFIKSHGKDAATSNTLQQLKLTGIGDPSGCGE
eukprot:8043-Heterococcus_DN1.PRE.2